MFRRLGLLCAALAMFSIAGGHWAALQTVAWAGMLRDYSQRNGSWLVALELTFDGQHPCNLCQRIATEKGKEFADQDQQSSSPDKQTVTKVEKPDKLITMEGGLQQANLSVRDLIWLSQIRASAFSRVEPPPTPPPRYSVS